MINTLILKLALPSKKDGGFTLIELLVVIAIVGILSAIALPSMLGQASKAKEVQAKTTIASVNSAQNAFRTENTSFAPDIDTLALGVPTDTANYVFDVVGKADTATITATPKDSALNGYVGGVVRYSNEGNSAIATIVCKTKVSGITAPVPPTLDSTQTTPEKAAACDKSQEKL